MVTPERGCTEKEGEVGDKPCVSDRVVPVKLHVGARLDGGPPLKLGHQNLGAPIGQNAGTQGAQDSRVGLFHLGGPHYETMHPQAQLVLGTCIPFQEIELIKLYL